MEIIKQWFKSTYKGQDLPWDVFFGTETVDALENFSEYIEKHFDLVPKKDNEKTDNMISVNRVIHGFGFENTKHVLFLEGMYKYIGKVGIIERVGIYTIGIRFEDGAYWEYPKENIIKPK